MAKGNASNMLGFLLLGTGMVVIWEGGVKGQRNPFAVLGKAVTGGGIGSASPASDRIVGDVSKARPDTGSGSARLAGI